MNNYKVKSPFKLTIRTLDLTGRLPELDSIEFLRVELQYEDGEWSSLPGASSIRSGRY